MTVEKFIVVRSARFVPVILLACGIWMGCTDSLWWFLSIFFIVIGWFSAAPNLNLANGMLAYLSMIGGYILMNYHRPSGTVIVVSTAAAYFLSALEMRVFSKPWNPGDGIQPKE